MALGLVLGLLAVRIRQVLHQLHVAPLVVQLALVLFLECLGLFLGNERLLLRRLRVLERPALGQLQLVLQALQLLLGLLGGALGGFGLSSASHTSDHISTTYLR